MNPIFDTAMLKHHRVDYGPRIDIEGTTRSIAPRGVRAVVVITMVVMVTVGFITGSVA